MIVHRMVCRIVVGILIAVSCWGAVPAPAEHFGFPLGEDYKLADFSQIAAYYHKLDAASDRLKLVEFGASANGRPMYLAIISSAANLQRLDHYRDISRRMALGLPDAGEARRLARDGKAVVWIDSGLHASEVAPAQHAPELAYRLITGESDEIRRIRENVILLQAPVMNPDGLDWIVKWYRKNLGTPYELAPLPKLYMKYSGHDNNRDWFMLNLRETRAVSRILYQEWFPQIVYNQHQMPAFPARIFVPPYADPLNPNLPSPVMEGIHLIGAAMMERFAEEDKPGVLSYLGFDAWWNGGMRTTPPFHNMHGILTETAGASLATPRVDEKKDLPKHFPNGLPTLEPTVFYQRPWTGGRWGVREAINYMLTADFALLDLAASRPEKYLLKAYRLARASMEAGRRGDPFGYIVPPTQWDRSSAIEMLKRLAWCGVQVKRARSAFEADGAWYPAGSYVLPAAQPFRPYLIDLMEPQRYPKLTGGNGKQVKRPYDVVGWTLPMSMGVSVNRVNAAFEADLEPVKDFLVTNSSRDHRENASFLTMAKLLSAGKKLRWGPGGEVLVKGEAPAAKFKAARWQLRRPRVALYEPWVANSDTGWTQWLFDTYEVPCTLLHNADFRKGGLRRRFDAIVFASQAPSSILNGYPAGQPTRKRTPELDAKSLQRPEYTGGIGIAGLNQLQRFVQQGGTLIVLDRACELPVEYFPLGVRDVARSGKRGAEKFYCPGSLLNISVDTKTPLAFGMPDRAIVMVRGGKAFEITLLPSTNQGDHEIRAVADYAASDLLASGWVSGEKAVAGKHILLEARFGKGKVILFGFRPQFRGQTTGAFKLLLNAVYLASAKQL